MNLLRRILEGIHEVELRVTPEFRKGWPDPKVWQRTSVGTDVVGHIRYLVVYRWPDATIATGLELFRWDDTGYELNVWAPGSTVKLGSWDEAMASIKKVHEYGGGIYVYVQNGRDPLTKEIIAADSTSAHETIDDKEPGDEPVVDYFLGYEGKPASQQQALAKPDQGIKLSGSTKLVVINRPWMHMTHPNAVVTGSNAVMVLMNNIPGDVAIQDKKRAIQERFEGLTFHTSWADVLQVWKVFPKPGQDPEEFNAQIVYLIDRIDELIDMAEET